MAAAGLNGKVTLTNGRGGSVPWSVRFDVCRSSRFTQFSAMTHDMNDEEPAYTRAVAASQPWRLAGHEGTVRVRKPCRKPSGRFATHARYAVTIKRYSCHDTRDVRHPGPDMTLRDSCRGLRTGESGRTPPAGTRGLLVSPRSGHAVTESNPKCPVTYRTSMSKICALSSRATNHPHPPRLGPSALPWRCVAMRAPLRAAS